MARLQRVHVGRHTDDRIVESRRGHGPPRPIPVWPRGPAAPLRQRRLTHPPPPVPRRSSHHGAVAALKAMAAGLGLVALSAGHLPPGRRPRSSGPPLGLAAIPRAVGPGSPRAWAAWAPRTSVHRLVASHPEALPSPSGGAQLAAVSGVALAASAAARPRTVVEAGHRHLAPLFYDTATVVPDLASGHERAALAQRGPSTQPRVDRRQVSLARVVARDGPSPRSADLDEGHTVAAPRGPASRTAIRPRLAHVVGPGAARTRGDDTGNTATSQQARVDPRPGHEVAGLGPSPHADRSAMAAAADTPWGPGPVAQLPGAGGEPTLGGVARTVRRFISATLRGLDHAALEQLEPELFGPRLLSSAQHAWSTAEIILA